MDNPVIMLVCCPYDLDKLPINKIYGINTKNKNYNKKSFENHLKTDKTKKNVS